MQAITTLNPAIKANKIILDNPLKNTKIIIGKKMDGGNIMAIL